MVAAREVPSVKRLDPKGTVVVVVDIQERLAAAMPGPRLADVVRAGKILIEAAPLLGASVLVTEQYPAGLGSTLSALDGPLRASRARRFEKLDFSALGAQGFWDALQRTRATSCVVVGMEAHVCVFQSVRDLVGRYLDVHVAADGVCSRRDDHRELGLRLCERSGAILTTAESVVFDWLERAGSDVFKQVAKLVR
jgi:nicotinamidase-related amidase